MSVRSERDPPRWKFVLVLLADLGAVHTAFVGPSFASYFTRKNSGGVGSGSLLNVDCRG
jgi:hypothetical protein